MKGIVKSIAFNCFCLFLLSQLLSGIQISQGLTGLLIAGIGMSILGFIVRPVLGVIFLPLTAMTFGGFKVVIDAVIFYLLLLFVKQVHIHAFIWSGISLFGIIIPKIAFNNLFAFLACALVYNGLKIILVWLTQE